MCKLSNRSKPFGFSGVLNRYVRTQISRGQKNSMEPPETSKLKNREIDADTFVQAFLQNMRESQRTLSRYLPQS